MVTTTFASPLGEILLAADGRGLTGLWFEGQEHFGSTLLKEDAEHVEGADAVSGTGGMSPVSPVNAAASSVLERSWAWLNTYFAGQEPRFTPVRRFSVKFGTSCFPFRAARLPRMARSPSVLPLDIVYRETRHPLCLLVRWGLRSHVIPFRLSCRAIAWWRPTDRSTDMPAALTARSGCCGSRVRTRSDARVLCL